jgi:hypothetical protein
VLFRPLIVSGAVLLVLASGACSDVRDRVDDLRADAEQVSEDAAFCLSVARAVASVEGSSPDAAADAAEEALAQAPEELREDARILAGALRAARDGDHSAVDDEAVRAAVERLRAAARDRCDPTS